MVEPISAAIGAGVGLLKGIGQGIEARRREKLNAEQSALDTAYAFAQPAKGQRVAEMQDEGILGPTLQGALSGYSQGQQFAKAGEKKDYYSGLRDKLKAGTANPQELELLKSGLGGF